MNRWRSVILVLLASMGGGAGARAGTITYTATGGLSLLGGADNLGLVGSTFTFIATFSDSAMYANVAGLPGLAALGDSLTIGGASVGGVDGTYQETFGITFRPTVLGQFFGGANQTTFARWTILGQPLTLGNMVLPMTNPSIGSTIVAADFSPIPAPSFNIFYTLTADYLIDDLRVSVTTSAIPEPSSMALVCLALLGGIAAKWTRLSIRWTALSPH
jgi:hypothetical protein